MIGLLGIAVLLAGYDLYEPDKRTPRVEPAATTSAPSQRTAREFGSATSLRLDPLAADQLNRYEVGGRNIFSMQERRIDHPKFPPQDGKDPFPATVQTSPPIPLKFCGFARKVSGPNWICLQDNEDVFIAKRGDTIERRYRIMEIKEDNALIEDLLNNNRQRIWQASR